MSGFKSPLVLVLLVLAGLPSLASEIEFVEERLQRLGYPMPKTTITRLHEIESELTPEPVRYESVVVAQDSDWFCDSVTLRIPYQLEKGAPVEHFEATILRPNRFAAATRFRHQKVFPAIVIQPTLAGPSILEQTIAFNLCLRGIASISPHETMIELPDQLPDFKAYDRNIRIEMTRARRMVDALVDRSDVDDGKIGAIGFSRGAIAGALLIGIEPRVRFAFFGGGGIGSAQIIAHSKTEQGQADNLRQMEAAGIGLEEFEAKLFNSVLYDGILFSHRVSGDNLKIMIIENDDSVATKYQELKRVAFDQPETIYRNRSHVGSIVHLVFREKAEYLDFFAERIRQLE